MGSFRAVLVPVLVTLCASFISSRRNSHDMAVKSLQSKEWCTHEHHRMPARYHDNRPVKTKTRHNGERKQSKDKKRFDLQYSAHKTAAGSTERVSKQYQRSYRSYADAVENGVPNSQSQSLFENGLKFGTLAKKSFAVTKGTNSVGNAFLGAKMSTSEPKTQRTWLENAAQARLNDRSRPENDSLASSNSIEQNKSSQLSKRHNILQYKPLIYRSKVDKWQYKDKNTKHLPNLDNQSNIITYEELYTNAFKELTSNQISSDSVKPNQTKTIDCGALPASVAILNSTDCVRNDCSKPKVLSPTFILPRMLTDSAMKRKLNPNAKPFVPAQQKPNALRLPRNTCSILGVPASIASQSPVNPFDVKSNVAKSVDMFRSEDDYILDDTLQAVGYADDRNKELLNLNHSSQPLNQSETIYRASQRSASHARTVGAKPQRYLKTNILQAKSLRPTMSTSFDNRCGTDKENIPKSLTQAFDSADNDFSLDQPETKNYSTESSYSFKERFGYSGWQ